MIDIYNAEHQQVVYCHDVMLRYVILHYVTLNCFLLGFLPGGPVAIHVDVQRNERAGRGRAVEYQTGDLLRKKFL